MKPVGHGWVVEALARQMPAVTLAVGPSSVGKRTVLRWALRQVVAEEDLLTFAQVGIADVREIRRFLTFRPSVPKGVFFRLDGASDQALSALLKLLEEPFANTYVAMASERRPVATIESRAITYRMAYLSAGEVAEVLVRQGYTPEEAARRARIAQGRVAPALGDVHQDMAAVLAVLRSVQMSDLDLLLGTLLDKRKDGSEAFGPDQVALLRTWAQERVSGRWRVFSEADASVSREVAQRVYEALEGAARPRVAVKRAVLAEMVEV